MPSANKQHNHEEVRQITNQDSCVNPIYVVTSNEYQRGHRKGRTVLT